MKRGYMIEFTPPIHFLAILCIISYSWLSNQGRIHGLAVIPGHLWLYKQDPGFRRGTRIHKSQIHSDIVLVREKSRRNIQFAKAAFRWCSDSRGLTVLFWETDASQPATPKGGGCRGLDMRIESAPRQGLDLDLRTESAPRRC